MFLSINSQDLDSESTAKSLELQRLELEKFEEIKQCYQAAINYIKEKEMADATNILINLYDNELLTFKSFDAKQLQKAVMKLLLSLKTLSSERQLNISLKGIEMFSDEKYYWECCADLLYEAGRFTDSVQIHDYLFKSDPFSSAYLKNYVQSLKRALMFDELEELQFKLKESRWISLEDEKLFDWRGDYENLAKDYQFQSNETTDTIEVLSFPLRDINWTNYALTLHAMATGNYSKIFKKQPFNPENYVIITGPCSIELIGSTQSTQFQSNTQSLLASSVHDYSASSMDDVNSAFNESKKRSLRRKDTRTAQQNNIKSSELTAADLIKNLKSILDIDERTIINTLCSTEVSCLQLLDKNNVVISESSIENNGNCCFSLEALVEIIKTDNEIKKPLALRIFDLLKFFLVTSLKTFLFPSTLTKPLIDLIRLLNCKILSFDNFKEFLGDNFAEGLLGICELFWDSKLTNCITIEFPLLKLFESSDYYDFLSENSKLRLKLLEILLNPDEDSIKQQASLQSFSNKLSTQSTTIYTRYTHNFPSKISSSSIQSTINRMSQDKIIQKAEELFYIEKKTSEALALFVGIIDSEESILNYLSNHSGTMKLRLCKVFLLSNLNSLDFSVVNSSAVSELINCHATLEISNFIDYLAIFMKNDLSLLSNEDKLLIFCIFWNIYSRKSLIPNNLLNTLNCAFVYFINSILILPLNLEVCRFFLQWAAQEKAFGSADGFVPLKIFNFFARSQDFNNSKFAYSVAFSLLRFPNIFATIDPDLGCEEWDRAPIGFGTRDCPCPVLNISDLLLLSDLIYRIDENIETIDGTSKLVVSEPGFVSFVDWFKKQFADLLAKFKGKFLFYSININRNNVSQFLKFPLEQHAQKQVLDPSRGHFAITEPLIQSFCNLLNTRSDLVYSELQGRKKSLDILKTIRSDLKLSLSLNIYDAEVWKLLGVAYHDAVVHLMSSETEVILEKGGKLKRLLKKGILALKQGLKLDQYALIDRDSWTKLMDLIDWSLHDPSQLSINSENVNFLCSIGCSCVQTLLPGAPARDRWILFLRLELFLRKSGNLSDHQKQLELLKEASLAACGSYSENVYESTALFMSLVKFLSRLSKLRMKEILSEPELEVWLKSLQGSLPTCLNLNNESDISPDHLLLKYFDALNILDRKKIFHSHVTATAWHAWKLLKDPRGSFDQLQQLFPFLKIQKKTNSASLLQIYQCEHERPARFLVAGKRYLLQLLNFLNESKIFDKSELSDLLTQFLKKLHYIRRTILGFPDILAKSTLIFLNSSDNLDLDIVEELNSSLNVAFNCKIPDEIKLKIESIHREKENDVENYNEIVENDMHIIQE